MFNEWEIFFLVFKMQGLSLTNLVPKFSTCSLGSCRNFFLKHILFRRPSWEKVLLYNTQIALISLKWTFLSQYIPKKCFLIVYLIFAKVLEGLMPLLQILSKILHHVSVNTFGWKKSFCHFCLFELIFLFIC